MTWLVVLDVLSYSAFVVNRALDGFCPWKRALKLFWSGQCLNYTVSFGVSQALVIPKLLVAILLQVPRRSSNYYSRWVFMQCSLGRFWVFRRVCLECSRQAWDSVDKWMKLKVLLTLNKWLVWMPVCSGFCGLGFVWNHTKTRCDICPLTTASE